MEKFEFGPIQKQWLKNLKEHPERQYKEALGVKPVGSSYEACCLGELALLAGVAHWSEGILFCGEDKETTGMYYEKLGLRSGVGSPKSGHHSSLATLNDDEMTWPEIAAHVEKYPEVYFTKSV